MLTGEYTVLDGALALALPVRYGQQLTVLAGDIPGRLYWKSTDANGNIWFEAELLTDHWTLVHSNNLPVAQRLQQLLSACRKQNPDFCADAGQGYLAQMHATFPLDWGLGSSSTLVAALAQWAGINPYMLLAATFGGSGYDVACAFADGPILYQLAPGLPAGAREQVQPVAYSPPYADQLYFYYLGKKQDSREGIRRYRSLVNDNAAALADRISVLTRELLQTNTLSGLESNLLEQEMLISEALDLPRAQALHFPHFPGVIKSLGAWGGDFVLATRPVEGGIPWKEMVLMKQK